MHGEDNRTTSELVVLFVLARLTGTVIFVVFAITAYIPVNIAVTVLGIVYLLSVVGDLLCAAARYNKGE